MNKRFALILLVALGLVTSILIAGCGQKEVTLTAYIGDGMKDPMLALKEAYEAQNPHVTVECTFAGSGTLEKTIRSLKQGDLYMPGAKKYIDGLTDDGIAVKSYPVALHVPAILVRKGDATVSSWDDLAKEGVRVGMSNPELASAGRAADKIIGQSPLEAQIRANVTELAADARDLVQLLTENEVDAVIVWRSTIRWAPDKIEALEIPADINDIKEIWLASLSYSGAESEATKFAEFVAGSDGRAAFSEQGFLLIGE